MGNLLTGRGINRVGKRKGAMVTSQGRGINRPGEGVLKAGYGRPSSSASHNNKIDF